MGKFKEDEMLIMHYDKKRNKFVDKTASIQWLSEDQHSIRVKFYNNVTFYNISYRDMSIYPNPKEFNIVDDAYIILTKEYFVDPETKQPQFFRVREVSRADPIFMRILSAAATLNCIESLPW